MLLQSLFFVCSLIKVFCAPIEKPQETEEYKSNQIKTEHLLNRLRHYEMVIPMLVDHEGKFLSYDVQHHSVRSRVKRDGASKSKSTQIFYKIYVFGKEFNFNLEINQKLLSKKYIAEAWSENRRYRLNVTSNCHYIGHSSGHPMSTAALSNCYGLHGVFQNDGEDMFVEPLWNHTSDIKLSGHPHVIYKRSDIKSKYGVGQCGVNNEFKSRHYVLTDAVDDVFDSPNYKQHKQHNGCLGENTTDLFHYISPFFEKHRRKRSTMSEEINVETLVVADRQMVEYHGKQIIESYVLSIMNIVATLFHDGSIGNAVNIVVSRLAILEKDQQNLTLSHHAGTSLDSFCTWQNLQNLTAESMGTAHHDNAVLLTGFDICTYKNQPCGTLGLAPVGGMCDHDRSCSINEDIGLASAYTVAHEIGHNFGMQHDGADNPCGTSESNEPAGIMAAKLTKDTRPFNWSSCSRAYITDFLDAGKGACLVNQPSEELLVRSQQSDLPKEKRDANTQCKLQFGETSQLCKPQEVCQELWCYNSDGRCVTNSIPAADGTGCRIENAENGWCYRGQCRPLDYQPEPQDGHWGEWSSWNDCTRSCGGGVESSHRKCNNPQPRDGGKYCIGKRKRYRSCNMDICPYNTRDFRELQCADYNNKPFRGKFYNWKPFTGAHDKPCALNCIAVGYNFYTERARKVIDGTRCYPDRMDMCINGRCLPVGCDGILESSAREDKCRVCNGNGTTCQTISGVFDRHLPKGSYQEVVIIPRGAVHIHIREVQQSKNYLALKSNRTGEYYINGDWTIDWPRKFSVGGTTFDYQRISNRPEHLQAIGPITEDLVVMLLLQEDNLGIEYEYNIPNSLSPSNHDASLYTWQHSPWSECSHSCGTGRRVSTAICVGKMDQLVVTNNLCVPQPKPSNQISECNTDPCPPIWSAGKWSSCSATCGRGRKVRTVICIQTLTQREQVILPEEECTDRKPNSVKRCRKIDCPSSWYTDEWSECSSQCGMGVQTRSVYCVTSDRLTRLSDGQCNQQSRPLSSQSCIRQHCPTPRWTTEEWGQCSVTCGRGRQERRVLCRSYNRQLSNDCSLVTKPPAVQECESICNIPKRRQDCSDQDKAQFCPLVVKFGYCHREYFYRICCNTCNSSMRDRNGRGPG